MYYIYKRINTAASVIVIKYLNPLAAGNQEDCKNEQRELRSRC